MFHRQIGDAPPRIQLIRRGESLCGTNIETPPAGSAMIALRLIDGQIRRRQNEAEQ